MSSARMQPVDRKSGRGPLNESTWMLYILSFLRGYRIHSIYIHSISICKKGGRGSARATGIYNSAGFVREYTYRILASGISNMNSKLLQRLDCNVRVNQFGCCIHLNGVCVEHIH